MLRQWPYIVGHPVLVALAPTLNERSRPPLIGWHRVEVDPQGTAESTDSGRSVGWSSYPSQAPARCQEACLKSRTAGFGLPSRTPQTNAVKIVSASARQSAAVDAFPGLEAQA